MKINFNILENIRGIAALYVVINHCRGHLLIGGMELSTILPIKDWNIFTKIHYGLLQFTSLGSEFVVVFFVLSGFSISYSISQNTKILQFYKKRLIRLYPPFILALVYAAVVFFLIRESIQLDGYSVFDSIHSIIRNVFYIPTGELIPQFWSLPLEVVFYIIAPFVLFSKGTKMYYYLLSIILFIISFFVSINNVAHEFRIISFILDYNIYFVIGILLHTNLERIKRFKIFNRKKTIIVATIFSMPLMIYLNIIFGHYNKLSFLVASIYSVFLIVCFLNLKIQINFIKYIGKISYTLYISHFASIYLYLYILKATHIIIDQPIQNPFVWLGGVVFSILLAIPFYYIAEKPTIFILTKLRQKKSAT